MRLSSFGPCSERGRRVWTASYADPTFARWISSLVSTLLRRWAASGDRPASAATHTLSTAKVTVRIEAPSRACKDSRRSGRAPAGSAVPGRLQGEQLGVQPAPRHELLVCPLVHQLAPLQYQDAVGHPRSEEHTSELQSPCNLVCRLLLEKKKTEYHLSLAILVQRCPYVVANHC